MNKEETKAVNKYCDDHEQNSCVLCIFNIDCVIGTRLSSGDDASIVGVIHKDILIAIIEKYKKQSTHGYWDEEKF